MIMNLSGNNMNKICPICNKTFSKKDIGVYGKEFEKRIYCSNVCMGIDRLGENNPNKEKRGGVKKGNVPWNKGLKDWTVGTIAGFQKNNITKSQFKKGHKGMIGILNPSWLGGKSFEEYGREFNKILKEKIRKRDNYKCNLCDIHQNNLRRKLDVHHIDYNKRNNNQNNLISLCHRCHLKTNHNRESWKNYFKVMKNTNAKTKGGGAQ